MDRSFQGYIPEKIVFISSGKGKVQPRWDDFDSDDARFQTKDYQLWIEADSWLVRKKTNAKEGFKEIFREDYYWNYKVTKTKTVVEDVEDTGFTNQEIISNVIESMERVIANKTQSWGSYSDYSELFNLKSKEN